MPGLLPLWLVIPRIRQISFLSDSICLRVQGGLSHACLCGPRGLFHDYPTQSSNVRLPTALSAFPWNAAQPASSLTLLLTIPSFSWKMSWREQRVYFHSSLAVKLREYQEE